MSELKVHASACDIEPMVQIEELRTAFVGRLKQALDAKGIPQWGAGARLAKITSVTPKAVSKWLNGESIPGAAKMLTLANALDVKVEWLQHGSGQGPESDSPPDPEQAPHAEPRAIPRQAEKDGWDDYAFVDKYTAKAAAGTGYDNAHVVLRNTLAFKRDWLRAKGANPKNLKVIYADGESMWPTISNHDVLLVDSSKVDPVDGGIFVLESTTDGTIVKRLVLTTSGEWILRSDNADKGEYPDRSFLHSESNEHRILGRVIWRGGDL